MSQVKKRARTTLVGYDRSKGGVIKGGLQAYRQNMMRAAMMVKEKGFADTALTSYGLSTTGTVALLSDINQGVGVSDRVGKKVSMLSLQCRGVAFAGTAGTIADGSILIVYDKRPTGALPAITDILNTVSSSAFNNADNEGRFKILKRQDMVFIGNSTTPATGCEAYTADFFLKLPQLPLVFKSLGTGGIADIEEGALYLVTVGSVASGTTAATASLGFRLRFVDI